MLMPKINTKTTIFFLNGAQFLEQYLAIFSKTYSGISKAGRKHHPLYHTVTPFRPEFHIDSDVSQLHKEA